MSNSIQIEDFKNICGICLQFKEILFSLTMYNIKKMLEICVYVQDIFPEKFPQQICDLCYTNLKLYYNFKLSCIKSFEFLWTIIRKNESFSINNDSIQENDTTENRVIKDESPGPSDTISENAIEISNIYASNEQFSDLLTPVDCLISEKNVKDIKKHRRKRQEKVLKKEFICDICGKIFTHRHKLKYHQIVHSEIRPYNCSICHRSFKQAFNLKSHIKLRHDKSSRREICNVCGKLILPISLRAHLDTHKTIEERSFKCSECDKIYSSRTALRTHIREKHFGDSNERKYFCDICDKTLVSKRTLAKHMVIVHSEMQKLNECHICGKKYKLESHIKEHIRTAHLNIRPHECDICKKAFHTKRLLKNHMRTHTGERPFSCSVCGKAFGFKNVLNTHMRVHYK